MTKSPEKIWAWALDTFNGKPFWAGEIRTSHAKREGTTEYRRADLPPKVKALVWVKAKQLNKHSMPKFTAHLHSFIYFEIGENRPEFGEPKGWYVKLAHKYIAQVDTIEDAKNVAQEFVLGCLEE